MTVQLKNLVCSLLERNTDDLPVELLNTLDRTEQLCRREPLSVQTVATIISVWEATHGSLIKKELDVRDLMNRGRTTVPKNFKF